MCSYLNNMLHLKHIQGPSQVVPQVAAFVTIPPPFLITCEESLYVTGPGKTGLIYT